MKRSNFTFLFLFALLSFVSTQSYGQATCISEVNANIDGETCLIDLSGISSNFDFNGDPILAETVVVAGVSFPATGSGAISIGETVSGLSLIHI